jgi:hypothetical protein
MCHNGSSSCTSLELCALSYRGLRHYITKFPPSALSDPRTSCSAYARTALIVRTTATVYNYDYIYNYVFHMDGAMEVAAAASGYLQARADRDHQMQ